MRILRFISCASLLAAFIFGAALPVNAQGQQVDKIEISQIDGSAFPSVTLYVRILDANGNKVPNLEKDQFTILEDGKEVKILDFQTSNASSIVTLMMMDVSGSMRENRKIESAREAGTTFVDLMRKDDKVGLWLFNHEISQSSDFTNDKNLLKSQISSLTASGGTSWHDAIIQCAQEIRTQTGRRSLLLLSDGMDENSVNNFESARKAAVDSQVPVYAIGLGGAFNLNRQELETLSNDTGGKYFEAPSADQLKQLYTEISQSTQEEYVITYESPRASFDGTRRNIDIQVNGVRGTGTWVESHLLNIESDPLVALIAALPLLALLLGPTIIKRISARRQHGVPNLPGSIPDLEPAQQQIHCNNCGNLLKPGARFCNTCGAQQPALYTGQPAQPPYSPQQQYHPPLQQAQPQQRIQNQGQHPSQTPPPVPTHQAQPPQTAFPKFCNKCGNPMRPGVRFCSRCGTRY